MRTEAIWFCIGSVSTFVATMASAFGWGFIQGRARRGDSWAKKALKYIGQNY